MTAVSAAQENYIVTYSIVRVTIARRCRGAENATRGRHLLDLDFGPSFTPGNVRDFTVKEVIISLHFHLHVSNFTVHVHVM